MKSASGRKPQPLLEQRRRARMVVSDFEAHRALIARSQPAGRARTERPTASPLTPALTPLTRGEGGDAPGACVKADAAIEIPTRHVLRHPLIGRPPAAAADVPRGARSAVALERRLSWREGRVLLAAARTVQLGARLVRRGARRRRAWGQDRAQGHRRARRDADLRRIVARSLRASRTDFARWARGAAIGS